MKSLSLSRRGTTTRATTKEQHKQQLGQVIITIPVSSVATFRPPWLPTAAEVWASLAPNSAPRTLWIAKRRNFWWWIQYWPGGRCGSLQGRCHARSHLGMLRANWVWRMDRKTIQIVKAGENLIVNKYCLALFSHKWCFLGRYQSFFCMFLILLL